MRKYPQAFVFVVLGIVLIRLAAEIDDYETEFIHVVRARFTQDDMLFECIAIDGVGTVLLVTLS